MGKKIVLLDSHSIIFRSYFAFIKNPLKNSRGETTSGIYGFLNTLEKIKSRLPTNYLILVFDAPGETFRDKAYKEYKATRPAPPHDIPFQIEKVKELVQYMGMPVFEIEGYEADDVLATLAVKLCKHGEVYIVTSDKDLLQMVGNNIYIYDAYKDLIYDSDGVVEKFGVRPEKICDYLALTGDSIDNVPGVPGIGPHRALEIIKKYSSLDEAMEQDKRLIEHKSAVLLSKELVKLASDVPLNVALEKLAMKEPDMDKLMPLLIDLEFHSYIKGLSRKIKPEIKVIEADIANITLADRFAFCTEGNKFYLNTGGEEVYSVPYESGIGLLTSEKMLKIGFDLKELMKMVTVKPPVFDIKVADWLLDPNLKSYSFQDICLRHLNALLEPAPAIIAGHAGQLHSLIEKKLAAVEEMKVYQEIEEPLIYVLTRMEKRGMKLDIPYLKDLSLKIEKETGEITKRIYDLAGKEFNINSPKQLASILFEDLKLTPTKKKKTHYSTDVEVLQQLGLKHELPREILKYRELVKVSSTYIEPLIALSKNNRIHTSFNQTGTATGRLSSSNPNIQNIPIRSDLGKMLRKGFVSEKGFLLISADYSQIELRVLAHMAKEKNLIQAFNDGDDIHNHTASLVFNVHEDKVNEQQRRMAKVVNYGLIYGMSDYGLSQGLEIPREEAIQFIQAYNALYSGVDSWRERVIAMAMEKGYAETLFGRKRPLPELHSDNFNLKEYAKRAAINTPIQGTAADLIKMAMVEVEKQLGDIGFKSGLLLSIHDELLFEVEEDRVDEAQTLIKKTMENVVKFEIAIEVTIGVGENWAVAHK